MHQRHPIRVDKSRALPAGNDRQITGSTQLSFHKIYRQKRCYSNFDKGKEGYSSSQWKSDCGNSSRESSIALEPRYSAGHNGFKATHRTDHKETIKSTGPSLLPSKTGSGKSDRDFPKRSFDRFSCNFTSGSDFDASVVKKQKVEHCRSSGPQHYTTPDFDHSKQPLDETKWMYKNQRAKMSGPYGVKQLVEGFQSRFLQVDLPIYQLYEGKLCKPIPLKQLMDDVQQSMRESGRRHSNQCMPSQRFSQVLTEERVVSDDDLPPGFGGRSSQFSQNPSCDYSPNSMSTVPGPRVLAHGFSSSGSDFEDTDLGLPPGFEGGAAIESQTSELCATPQNPSLSIGVAGRREGVRVMHLGYEQEPAVHDRGHASWQGSSPHSVVGYSTQGTNTGSEISLNGHTGWAYAPAATAIPSFESQAFLQPTVCIGLPVSKSATGIWPIASNLPSGVFNAEPYNYPNFSTLANNTVATKESIGFLERQSPDPLSLILSELLAAVKRTYVSSILSALIGEQLDCWLDANRHWMGRVLSFDKESPTRGAGRKLSKTEAGMCDVDATVSHDEASGSAETSTLHFEASTATTSCPNMLSQAGDARGSEGSCLANNAASLGESQELLLTETRNDANLCHAVGVVGSSLSSNAQNIAGAASKLPSSCGKAVNFSLGPDKGGFFVSNDQACKMSTKLSSSMGNATSQTFSIPREEMKHKSDAFTCGLQCSGKTSDAVQLEAKPPLLAASLPKKENLKSLKQLMLITSKLRSTRLKSGLSKKTGSKLLCSKSPKALEIRQRNWIQACEGYDGCARTSVCGSWKKDAHGDGHCVDYFQIKDQNPNSGVSCMQTLANLAGSHSALVESLTVAADDSDVLNLTLSKLVNKRSLKVARSNIHKWGVFSAEAVEVGDFVIEYLGELVRSRVADIREERYAKSGIGSGYLFRIDSDSAVDATKRGGLARFINHSCDPNCYIKIVTVEGLKRVLIFAKRHIQAGEEVTYDYKSVHGALNVLCSCGSSKCRGSST